MPRPSPSARSRRAVRVAGVAGLGLAALVAGSTATAAPATVADTAVGTTSRAAAGATPNPYLANLTEEATKADYAAWQRRMAAAGQRRADSAALRQARAEANRTTPAAAAVVVHDEQEPAGTAGSNDSFANAERIPEFGTAKSKNNVVRILGARADLTPSARTLAPTAEDNGSIPLSKATGLDGTDAVRTTGTLGDGPHGSAPGDDTNDFDFYTVDLEAGLTLVADTSGQATDTLVVLYDEAGEVIAEDDDGGTGFASRLEYPVEASGTYYLMVAGYSTAGSLPTDPNDSGSGEGGAKKGPYNLLISQQEFDSDFYAVRLRPGDVVGGVANGSSNALTVLRPDGSEAVGAPGVDASSLYPAESPLPGGGNTTFAYVTEEAGWYVLEIGGSVGDYAIQIEGYRPGAQLDRNKNHTVLLDFEGGRVNTAIWGGPGVRNLSPFSAFLGKWGIGRARERAMINKITTQVQRNLDEVADGGLNAPKVTVVNSRNHPELAGKPNVSHVYVAGTIDESGIPTIGIAQYIDPGNYAQEDKALVLLDVLSEPGSDDAPASLNSYITEESDVERFVAQGVGNVTAHEIGHLVGSYHTENTSDQVNLMDAGGANFDGLFGVGPDGVGGTDDDPNVRFTQDIYDLFEGFSGEEDTQNNTAWAYPPR